MEDEIIRQRIRNILDKQIEMEGGRRRKRSRKPAGRMIVNSKGKLVSYKKHMQGKKLAAMMHGSKTRKRTTRKKPKKLRGYGIGEYNDDDNDDIYGYGYVPEFYTNEGPKEELRYAGIKNGYLYGKAPIGVRTPNFYNPKTGKLEKALYGLKLQKEMDKYATAFAKNRPKPLTKRQLRRIEEYQTALNTLEKGDILHRDPQPFTKAEVRPDLTEFLTAISEKKTPSLTRQGLKE